MPSMIDRRRATHQGRSARGWRIPRCRGPMTGAHERVERPCCDHAHAAYVRQMDQLPGLPARQGATVTFTLRGHRLEIAGHLDASASVAFWAVVQFLLGDDQVDIDVSGCDRVDPVGHQLLTRAAHQLRDAGGAVTVDPRT